MLTITPVVLTHNRRKDGSYNVKIRVCWKGQNRYIATNLWCTKNDLTRAHKIKNPAIIDAAARLVGELRESVAGLSPALMENLTAAEIVARMKGARAAGSFRLDLLEYGRRFASRKTPSTARAYTMALGALERWLGRPTLDVNEVTKSMLLEFAKAVDGAGKVSYNQHKGTWTETGKAKQEHGQSYRHMMKLAAIYHAARDEYNDEDAGVMLIPRDPFRAVRLEAPMTVRAQGALGVETIQRVIDAEAAEDDPATRVALGAFVVSFSLMGANLADLYAARPFDGDVWVYNRRKTASRRADRAEMRVDVPPELAGVLARMRGDKRWWLGALHDLNPKADQITARVNKSLRRWCAREGLEPFTFYAARHSWATIARNVCGIDKGTVDECLDHVGDYRLADIYIQRDWTVTARANGKVLALFRFM